MSEGASFRFERGRPVYAPPGVLEASWFHHFLVALNRPAAWPRPAAWALALALIAGVGGLWSLTAGLAWGGSAAGALALLAGADALLLRSLPRLRLSFGPVRPQFFILLVPRLATALAGALLALWSGPALACAIAGGVNAIASLALAWGSLIEPGRVTLTTVRLPALSALRLLHISDLHVERFGRREEHLLELVEALQPDLIVATGDYVNLSCADDPIAHAAARRVLEGLRAPAGVFATLGSPPVDRYIAPIFEGSGVRLLRDEGVLVEGPAGERLALLGMDCSHDRAEDERVLAGLSAAAPADAYRILLYHSPDLGPVASDYGMDLYLCGHTHGGQIRLPGYGALVTSSQLGKRFEMGRYQVGRTLLVVSRGVGLEGLGAPRVRFLCRPEVILFSARDADCNRSGSADLK